jgi:hypothetical protein
MRILMGLEAYLLAVTFKEPAPMSEFTALLLNGGAVPVAPSSQTDFELRDQGGLTELHVDGSNTVLVRSFFLRFSILSPHTVIDQAFAFLIKLSEKKPIKLFDTHLK